MFGYWIFLLLKCKVDFILIWLCDIMWIGEVFEFWLFCIIIEFVMVIWMIFEVYGFGGSKKRVVCKLNCVLLDEFNVKS